MIFIWEEDERTHVLSGQMFKSKGTYRDKRVKHPELDLAWFINQDRGLSSWL